MVRIILEYFQSLEFESRRLKEGVADRHPLGTIHLRRRQIFTIFDPYPPTISIPEKCL